jgi:hypothetical protein
MLNVAIIKSWISIFSLKGIAKLATYIQLPMTANDGIRPIEISKPQNLGR